MGAPLKWFPLYVDDVETDELYRSLKWEERGIFWSLIFWEWREGSIPTDVRRLARSLNAPRGPVRVVLQRMFNDDGSGSRRSVNRRLEQIRNDQYAKSERASKAGSRSAATRRQQRGNDPVDDLSRRSRSRIRSEIEKSLKTSAHAATKGKGDDPPS